MIYVLFHSDQDGSFAAVAAHYKYGDDATYIPVQYGKAFPNITLTRDDELYILDFSYSRTLLDELNDKVGKLQVLDHHISAMRELKNLPYVHFDLTKCGSTLAWEYFRPYEDMPEIYHLVEDRDLFRHSFEDTDIVAAGLELYPILDIAVMAEHLDDPDTFLEEVKVKGRIAREKLNQHVHKLVHVEPKEIIYIDGYVIAIYNDTSTLSDIAKSTFHKCPDIQVVIGWRAVDAKIIFTLRSQKGSDVDVSSLAKRWFGEGSGGHKHAGGGYLPVCDGFKLISSWYEQNKHEVLK